MAITLVLVVIILVHPILRRVTIQPSLPRIEAIWASLIRIIPIRGSAAAFPSVHEGAFGFVYKQLFSEEDDIRGGLQGPGGLVFCRESHEAVFLSKMRKIFYFLRCSQFLGL